MRSQEVNVDQDQELNRYYERRVTYADKEE